MVTPELAAAASFFIDNAEALAFLAYDISLGSELDTYLGVGESNTRNKERFDAIVQILSDLGAIPAAIVDQMKADPVLAGELLKKGIFKVRVKSLVEWMLVSLAQLPVSLGQLS